MGPDKFLHGRVLYLDRLFTWNSANSVTDRNGVPANFETSRGI